MDLDDKLRSVGLDPRAPGEPAAAFAVLRGGRGEEATVIDRYELEARHRGVGLDAIPIDERLALAQEVLAVRGYELVGSPSGEPVAVVQYDPSWPDLFAEWRVRLFGAFGDTGLAVEHMGSTAVPGLESKPVVDIAVAVPDIDDEASYVRQIESCGVALRSRDAVHRYFKPPPGSPRVVQVHVSEPDGSWWAHHLLFRDYLRAHPAVAADYGELKVKLAADHRRDRVAYTDLKGAFIREALATAEVWAEATAWSPR